MVVIRCLLIHQSGGRFWNSRVRLKSFDTNGQGRGAETSPYNKSRWLTTGPDRILRNQLARGSSDFHHTLGSCYLDEVSGV